MSEDRLTRSPLFELFGSQGERGKQLHNNIEHYVIHCERRRDPRKYIETLEEVFHGLEQVDERDMVGIKAVGRLVYLGVTRIPISELENCTYGK